MIKKISKIKKKNFTALTDTLFSIDKNPHLRKLANQTLKKLINSTEKNAQPRT